MEKSLWERSQHAAVKRKNKNIITVILLSAVVLVLVLFLRSCAGSQSKEELLKNQDTFYKGIYVEDISLEGMTKKEAKKIIIEKLEKKCQWNMQAVYEDKVYPIEDLLSCNLDAILEEAFEFGHNGDNEKRLAEIKKLAKHPLHYTIEKKSDEKILDTIVEKAADELNTKAINADLIGFDFANNEFLYSEAVDGLEMDQIELKEQIVAALNKKEYDAKLQVKMTKTVPQLDKATVKEIVTLIGTFQTTTTNNADRNENIRLASDAINGMVLKPGDEFSMNKVTGPRTEAEGYKKAGTISNGKLVEEPGGGVCQVSTTLYNAVVKAGIKTTERFSHSLEPAYVNAGEDAMVSYPGNDFKFVNNGTSSIVIIFHFYNNQLSASIYGIPILEEGITMEMASETAEVIPIPEPIYEEDPSLEYQEEVIVNEGREGKKVVTYLVTIQNGVEISREFFHNSTYQGKAPVIKRNSKAKEPEPSVTPIPSVTPQPSPDAKTLNPSVDTPPNEEAPEESTQPPTQTPTTKSPKTKSPENQ